MVSFGGSQVVAERQAVNARSFVICLTQVQLFDLVRLYLQRKNASGRRAHPSDAVRILRYFKREVLTLFHQLNADALGVTGIPSATNITEVFIIPLPQVHPETKIMARKKKPRHRPV